MRVLKHKLSSVVEWADTYFLRRVKEVAMLSLESDGNPPKADGRRSSYVSVKYLQIMTRFLIENISLLA